MASSLHTYIRRFIPILAAAAFIIAVLPQVARADCPTCPQLNLPAHPVNILQDGLNNTESLFIVTLTGVGTGFSVQDGTPYLGWCGDQEPLGYDIVSTATLYSSYGSNLPANATLGGKWPMVNYILNHKQGNFGDVQRAIWIVINGTSLGTFPQSAQSDAMVTAAQTNGTNFIPQSGQIVAVLLYQDGYGGAAQDSFIEVTVPPPGNGVRGSIGDFVWYDLNHNGLQDAGEPGINGVKVTLYDSSNNVLATTHTDYTGKYLFTSLQGGNYNVQVDQVPGAASTLVQVGTDRSIDSNADALHNAPVTLPAGATDLTIDFGFFPRSGGCTLTWGYWKNHTSHWYQSPQNMALGNRLYTFTQLKTILGTSPGGGDASLILAHQLIAAKFNIAVNGTSLSHYGANMTLITQADALLAQWGGDLSVPHIMPTGSLAANMIAVASQIDALNQDGSVAGCNGN
jgi:hypothetical protein